jgi:phage gp46-like protein
MAPDNAAAPIGIEHWAGVRELVLMSIGTDKGSWWADPGFGSDLWISRREGKVNGRTAGTVRRALDECLEWLKRDGIAAAVDCRAEWSGKNEIEYTVTVTRPNGDPVIVRDTWHAFH